MHSLTEAAREYINAGLHVLALHHKRPNSRFHSQWSWENSIHGTVETAEDEVGLAAVFDHASTTGVAILVPQGVLVADVDTEAAAMLFMELAGGLPDTATAKTPRGLHIWYQAWGRDQSVWLGGSTLLLKGFGGYVCVSPSRHFDEDGVEDGVYTWIDPLVVDGVIQPTAFLPERMVGVIAAEEQAAVTAPRKTREVLDPVRLVPVGSLRDGTLRFEPIYLLDGLMRAIREAPDGSQNSIIHWATCRVMEEGIPYAVASERLLQAAIEGGHPRDRAKATINGVYKRQRRRG